LWELSDNMPTRMNGIVHTIHCWEGAFLCPRSLSIASFELINRRRSHQMSFSVLGKNPSTNKQPVSASPSASIAGRGFVIVHSMGTFTSHFSQRLPQTHFCTLLARSYHASLLPTTTAPASAVPTRLSMPCNVLLRTRSSDTPSQRSMAT